MKNNQFTSLDEKELMQLSGGGTLGDIVNAVKIAVNVLNITATGKPPAPFNWR